MRSRQRGGEQAADCRPGAAARVQRDRREREQHEAHHGTGIGRADQGRRQHVADQPGRGGVGVGLVALVGLDVHTSPVRRSRSYWIEIVLD